MMAIEKLAEARAHLSDVRVRIQLLREERRVLAVVAWWEAEVARISA